MKTTVLLVDDEALVRRGLKMLLGLERDVEVIGEAASIECAVALVHALRPDIVLLDLGMPGSDGVSSIEEILREAPNCRIVVLTIHEDAATRRCALGAGASAFVSKRQAADGVLSILRRFTAEEDTS